MMVPRGQQGRQGRGNNKGRYEVHRFLTRLTWFIIWKRSSGHDDDDDRRRRRRRARRWSPLLLPSWADQDALGTFNPW